MDVRDSVHDIVRRHFLPEAIHDETKLISDLGADSLDAVELSMMIEETFDLAVDEFDLQDAICNRIVENLTVGDLVAYVNTQLNQRVAA